MKVPAVGRGSGPTLAQGARRGPAGRDAAGWLAVLGVCRAHLCGPWHGQALPALLYEEGLQVLLEAGQQISCHVQMNYNYLHNVS